ncbi:hypothetical protein Sphch_1296 [Sphingobium chlorophenolicum L-1]|uniref:Capsule biosynthesis protein n=1 Tax=Sphingobium chlorophenolicum L-1 TaxID=690566 RepID=F6EWL3_SPHCR|nr:DUF6356 family protein [Sphingobium chlorophenolicum]AEG48985.1 hypothetical protein Sphch_1296 [Sphingobium chlorophenolicum L-1]
MFKRIFLDHPHQVGETYFEHLRAAGSFGTDMVVAGVACLVHAILPNLFTKTGSDAVARLHDRMVVNRRSKVEGEAAKVARP